MKIDIVKHVGMLYAVVVQGVVLFKGSMKECIDKYEELRYDGIEEIMCM